MLELRSGSCFPRALITEFVALSVVDGSIAVLAFWQLMRIHSRTVQLGWTRQKLMRIHSRTVQLGWTRQKVLHLMIGFSNLGYFIYFVLTLFATCEGWKCWVNSCGFIYMAIPKILFLAAFLLMLSFWIDLCHHDDDEDDEEYSFHEALLENISDSSAAGGHRKCLPIPSMHVGSRQKIVVLVTIIGFILMISFAVLIWIGMGKNPINSSIVARVYVDFFAIAILLLGGALACYGILIFMKMSNVRSERSSTDRRKVIGLATVSLTCFTSSALVALLTDVPLLYRWRQQYAIGLDTALLVMLYYFVGSSVPSAFVVWIMRELPPSSTAIKNEEPRIVTYITDGSTGVNNPQRWTSVACSQNQVSRVSPI